MENKKLTKRESLEMIKTVCAGNEAIINFCDHELELLDRKNSKTSVTKTQAENVKVAQVLVEELTKLGKPVTITELMNSSDTIKAYKLENGNVLTNQKITAIFKQLVDNKTLVKVIDKKKSYFSIAD